MPAAFFRGRGGGGIDISNMQVKADEQILVLSVAYDVGC